MRLVRNDRAGDRPFYHVLGVRIYALDVAAVIALIQEWIEAKTGPQVVSFTGMHGITEAQRDPVFRDVLNSCDLVVPDGWPVMLRGRLAGFPLNDRVAGPDLMRQFCAETGDRFGHFFLGGPPGLAEDLATRLNQLYGIRCVGAYSPPFTALSAGERRSIIERINQSGADVLWIGLSTPKQERWAIDLRSELRVPVVLTVGAAFDFLAGTKKRAPAWMRRRGLEWLHRMLSEPERLAKRYVVDGSRFLVYNALELFRQR